MNSKRPRLLALSAAVIASLVFTACAGEAPAPAPAPAQPTAAEAPKAAEEPKPTEQAPAAEAPAAESPTTQAKVAPGSLHNKDEYEALTGTKIEKYHEAPSLAEAVAAGKLPPVEQRLPENPVVAVPWNEVGEYGGAIRWDEYTVGYDHYMRHIGNSQIALRDASETTYYNAGPSAPDPAKPFIVEGWTQNADATEFTIKLRKGLKWSDGVEVTTDDWKFHIEDELLNPDLVPMPPEWLRWNPDRKEVTTKVEFPDKYTVKITFAMPYGSFINQQFRENSWGAWGSFMAPAHYFKQFHTKYTDIEKILPRMAERGFKTAEEWPNFYTSIWVAGLGDSGPYYIHPYAKELPVLYPWIVDEVREDGSATLKRNPYYYVIDPAGNQLPYLDNLRRQFISTKEQMNLDIIAGKVDVQGQFIKIDDFTLFKDNEDKGNYNAIPTRAWQHHVLIYWLNPVVTDTLIAAALNNLEFRRALSIALDREQINEAVFRGLGIPAQFAPPIGTPLYDEALSRNAAEYDPEGAKAILDNLGYKDTDGDGFREAPDGSKFIIPILYYQVTPAADAGVQFAIQYWGDVGLKVETKQVEGLTFWQSQGANEVAISVWWANGPDFGDGAFISGGVNAPLWSQWYNTNGERGVEPPAWYKRIRDIQTERLRVPTVEEQRALDAEGWKLLNENLFIIGTVEGAKNPLILSKDLGNVEYGFDKNFVSPTYWEWAFQWYYKNPARR